MVGVIELELLALWRTVAPLVLARRSIATPRPVTVWVVSVVATVALILLMFSIRPSEPEASRIAVAVPLAPLMLAEISPELPRYPTDAPPSICTARTSTASTAVDEARMAPPSTRIVGVPAPAPSRRPVASALTAAAVIAPATRTPPSTVALPPRPPSWMAVASTPS